jgi:hypothetical protein
MRVTQQQQQQQQQQQRACASGSSNDAKALFRLKIMRFIVV